MWLRDMSKVSGWFCNTIFMFIRQPTKPPMQHYSRKVHSLHEHQWWRFPHHEIGRILSWITLFIRKLFSWVSPDTLSRFLESAPRLNPVGVHSVRYRNNIWIIHACTASGLGRVQRQYVTYYDLEVCFVVNQSIQGTADSRVLPQQNMYDLLALDLSPSGNGFKYKPKMDT